MTVRKFYGCAEDCNDDVVNEQDFKKAADLFYADNTGMKLDDNQGQSLDQANAVFFGIDQKKKGHQLGKPIPGYSGHNQRTEADNIFGMTYANAR